MQNKNNFTVLCDRLVTFLWFNDNSDFSLTWLINLCKLTTIATTYLDWEQDGEPAKHSWRVGVWMYTCNTKSFSHRIYSIWPALMVQSISGCWSLYTYSGLTQGHIVVQNCVKVASKPVKNCVLFDVKLQTGVPSVVYHCV